MEDLRVQWDLQEQQGNNETLHSVREAWQRILNLRPIFLDKLSNLFEA